MSVHCQRAHVWSLIKVQWDYIHSKPAKAPVWLEKSQRFSEGANNSITEYSYLRACKERGVEPDPVQLEKYKNNTENFFFRRVLDIPQESVDGIWEDFRAAAKVIYLNPLKTKNITRDCNWCQFRPICYAELTGGDAEYIIANNYTVKEEENTNGIQTIDE